MFFTAILRKSEGNTLKRLKKIIATATICTLAISMMGCKMIEKTPEAIAKTVIAKVGDDKITKGELETELERAGVIQQIKATYGEDYESNEQANAQIKQVKQQYLDMLINQKIMLKKAAELGILLSDEEANKIADEEIAKFTEAYGGEDQYKQALEQYGYTEESFKNIQVEQAKLNAIYDEMTKDVKVTDDDLKNYYEENKDSQYTTEGEIDYNKSLEVANSIKAKLDAGADFAETAKEKSTDPGTKDNGGSLGFVKYNDTQYVTEFMDGFKNLKEGEISQPVKSQFGYHIIKVTGVTNEGADVSHILIAERGESTITPFEEVKETIKSQLTNEKTNATYTTKLEEWKKTIDIKTYENRL